MPMVSSSTLTGPRRVGRAFLRAGAAADSEQIIYAADHDADN
jgi:hypothetical protein